MRVSAMLSFAGLCLCAAVMGGCSTVTYEVKVMNQTPQTVDVMVDWPTDFNRFTLNQGQSVKFKAKIDKDVLPGTMTFKVKGLPDAKYPLDADPSTNKIFAYVREKDTLVINDKTAVHEDSQKDVAPKVKTKEVITGDKPGPT